MKSNLCGKRVKLARVEKDLKQVDLAAALSVDHKIEITQKGISNVEIGLRRVTDIELVALAKTLDVSATWLLYGDKKDNWK
jgi:transcriptional regulator with XRE-family HTH domain